MTDPQLHVLVLAEHARVRSRYRELLERKARGPISITDADPFSGAIEVDLRHVPDCILLDWGTAAQKARDRLLASIIGCVQIERTSVVLLTEGDDWIEPAEKGWGDWVCLPRNRAQSGTLAAAVLNTAGMVRLRRRVTELETIQSDFLSTASHELRTPLTIVREFVALVSDGVAGEINEEQRDCLDSALEACDRLGRLIYDLLDVQKIETGAQGFLRRPTDLTRLLGDCADSFLPQCQRSGLRLGLEVEGELPPVLCVPDKIAQVLANLLSNAIRFTPEGGKITLRSRVDRSTDGVEVSVEDTGRGIAPEFHERVFEKFTQVDRVDGPGYQGTGLGLAIVRDLIRLHGGDVELQSEPGTGSLFNFRLPIYTAEKEQAAFLTDHLRTAQSRSRELWILVVRLDSPVELEDLERFILQCLRRKEDATLLTKSERMILVAAEGTLDGGRALLARLRETIREKYGRSLPFTLAGEMLASDAPIESQLQRLKKELGRPPRHDTARRVLMIDDEPDILTVLRRALERSPVELRVECAADGYEGCLRFGELEPHLLVLDINMPGFDGEQVLMKIKDHERWNETKVIVISGDPARFPRMKELGADECVVKPLKLGEFVQKVNELFAEDLEEVAVGTAHESSD